MSGNIYVASFVDVAITAAQDLFEILCPSDAVLEILEAGFSQRTDFGDTAAEGLLFTMRMVSGAPTSGSGGSTATPRPTNLGSAASGCTVEINNTSQLSGGTNVVLEPGNFNIQLPERFIWIPETRYYISPSTRFVWELDNAPTDSITASGYVKWREIGG